MNYHWKFTYSSCIHTYSLRCCKISSLINFTVLNGYSWLRKYFYCKHSFIFYIQLNFWIIWTIDFKVRFFMFSYFSKLTAWQDNNLTSVLIKTNTQSTVTACIYYVLICDGNLPVDWWLQVISGWQSMC